MKHYIDTGFYNKKTEELIKLLFIYTRTIGCDKWNRISRPTEYKIELELLSPEDFKFNYNDGYYRYILIENENDFDVKFNFIHNFVDSIPNWFFKTWLYEQNVVYFQNGIYDELKKWLASMNELSEFSECHGIESIGYSLDEAATTIIRLFDEIYRFECAAEGIEYKPENESVGFRYRDPETFYERINYLYWYYIKTGDENTDLDFHRFFYLDDI